MPTQPSTPRWLYETSSFASRLPDGLSRELEPLDGLADGLGESDGEALGEGLGLSLGSGLGSGESDGSGSAEADGSGLVVASGVGESDGSAMATPIGASWKANMTPTSNWAINRFVRILWYLSPFFLIG
jgi:hypothetical protein